MVKPTKQIKKLIKKICLEHYVKFISNAELFLGSTK